MGQTSSANFEIPQNYSFNNDDDYKKYESDILKCIEYMINAPVNDMSDYRKRVNSFFMDWLTGTPDVSISINASVNNLYDKNKQFLIIFMAGWVKYALLNNYDNDKYKGYLAGIETILDVYRRGKGVKRDPNIIKIIKLQDEGKLLDWVKNQI
jgi:hypothetical protein